MHPEDIKHGYVYAVFCGDDSLNSLEPYLAVETDVGIRFAHAWMFDLDLSIDGPHRVPAEIALWARNAGWILDCDDIWSFWSQREELEEILGAIEKHEAPTYSVAIEAEKILKESGTPEGRASTWLRHSPAWSGSSMSAIYDNNDDLAGAHVTIFTQNPYKLRALLRWLGMPHDVIEGVTNIDKLGRKIRRQQDPD